jgi:hypothetical protein
MNSLVGSPGELTMTMTITRKDTGKVEEFQVIGKVTAEEAEALGLTTSPTESEADDERYPQHGG